MRLYPEEDLHAHTATPWRVEEYNDEIVEAHIECEVHDDSIAGVAIVADAKHIVKCVNMHNELMEALQCATIDADMILNHTERKARAMYYRRILDKAE